MSQDATPRGQSRNDKSAGALVVSNRVSPSNVDDQIVHELLDEGIVGLAYYTGAPTLDTGTLSPNNTSGRGSYSAMEKFSRTGGYVVSHMDKLERVLIGRARPGSLRFERITESDGSEFVLKCVELDAWGEINRGEFKTVDDLADEEGLNRFTFNDLTNRDSREDQIEQVVSAVTVLERDGRLNYR